MLTWTTTEAHHAAHKGVTYRVCENFIPVPPGRYLALASYTDGNGRLWESVLGAFKTVYEAKAACENEAKS